MLGVCLIGSGGHWENQWSFVLSNFQPDRIYLIGEVATKMPVEPQRIETAEEIPGHLVILSPSNAYAYPGKIALPDYAHPEECTYLFGSDHRHLDETYLGDRVAEDYVYIPTDTKDNMYSFVAGAVTLYDRMAKRGQSDH